MKSFVPANAIAAVISVTSTMAHALCHRAFASCSRSISVSFSLLLPTCFPHSKFSFFCTSANTPYIKGIHPFSHQRREENQLYKSILILLYFYISTRKSSVFLLHTLAFICKHVTPPRFFWVSLTGLIKFNLILCFSALTPYILFHYSNSPIYFIEISILYFLPLNRVFPAARCIFRLLP